MTIMVMPMAGNGVRTSNIFDGPKPLIPINGFPMFYWAAKNIIADKKIFIVRRDHIIKYNINKIVKNLFPEAIVLVQEEKLSGQLLSTLIAKEYLDTSEDIVIADCDMYSDFDFNDFLNIQADAGILTFSNNEKNYSYVLKDFDFVIGIAEKQAISQEAVGGVFYWKHGYKFLKHAKDSIANNIKTNGEYYISGVYTEAISKGCRVKTIFSENTYDLSLEDQIKLFIKEK
jgi:NDP-sugar pyrophosphorylase family protein